MVWDLECLAKIHHFEKAENSKQKKEKIL